MRAEMRPLMALMPSLMRSLCTETRSSPPAGAVRRRCSKSGRPEDQRRSLKGARRPAGPPGVSKPQPPLASDASARSKSNAGPEWAEQGPASTVVAPK